MWFYIVEVIIMIIAAVLAVALAPKPKPPQAATLYDFDIPVAEDGKPVTVIFGTVWISSFNVLWYGALETTPISKSSGK
jgi:uncharacterized membrane protein